MSDKKALAAMIIGMGGSKKKPMDEQEPDTDSGAPDEEMGEGKSEAAKEILDAIEAKDADQLMTALENFIEMCKQD